MGLVNRVRERFLGKPLTASYKHFPYHMFTQVRDLPLFTYETIRQMLIDPTIRLGLAMRAAPLYQAEFAYKIGASQGVTKWVPGVIADRPEVARFVYKQLGRIWSFDLDKILSAQIWGWSAGEVTYKLQDGQVQIDRLLERAAIDVLALRRGGELAGTRVQRMGAGLGHVDLEFPKSWWHAYNAECDSPYGVSACKGAHSPWADKWLNGGALDVRRLFAHKDAYGGLDMGYPPGTTNIDGKGEVPNRDIVREMAEQAKAGHIITRPSKRYADGSEMWPIERATVPSNPTHIFDYPKQLDIEMLRGLEIPDDVLTSEGSGAWQGKQVPMQAFFTNADRWLSQVVAVVVTQLMEPFVLLNYGKAEAFEVQTKPLAQQAMEQMRQPEGQAQQQPGTQPGQQRMAVDEPTAAELLVGRGIVDAADLVAAGRKFLERNGHGLIRSFNA